MTIEYAITLDDPRATLEVAGGKGASLARLVVAGLLSLEPTAVPVGRFAPPGVDGPGWPAHSPDAQRPVLAVR